MKKGIEVIGIILFLIFSLALLWMISMGAIACVDYIGNITIHLNKL